VKKIPIIAIAVGVILVLTLLALKVKSLTAPKTQQVQVSGSVPVKSHVDRQDAPTGFDALLKSAVELESQGELVKARDALRSIMAAYVSSAGIGDAQKRLEDINVRIMLSAINLPGETAIREVAAGDSLSMIADEYHTTAEFIKKQNGLRSDVIRPGQRLRIWTGKFSALIDKSQNSLVLKSNGEIVKTYRVSTGKSNITPTGNFKVVNKLVKPTWTHDGKVIPPESPENILGTRWLGFNIPGYGIHGTTQPESIGQQTTAGCVRMLNNEVEELYDILPVNTEVTIID
jgi:lipoprotein-anchoring transpeptidase ErfK/SrfK